MVVRLGPDYTALPNRRETFIGEFARAARVHVKTIRRGVLDGTVPNPRRIGGRRKFAWDTEVVAAFLGIDLSLLQPGARA